MSQDNPPVDHVAGDGEESSIETHLKSRPTWLRLVFMLIFYALISVAALVSTVVVVLGFLWVLFTGDTNPQLKKTGQSLATYLSQVLRYLTFNSDERPFPFDLDWPDGDVD
jgi:Flp pilus assembly protein TadB